VDETLPLGEDTADGVAETVAFSSGVGASGSLAARAVACASATTSVGTLSLVLVSGDDVASMSAGVKWTATGASVIATGAGADFSDACRKGSAPQIPAARTPIASRTTCFRSIANATVRGMSHNPHRQHAGTN
jgi:hypothetical protein